MLLGAIDVGTNSIHLIVVELDARFGTSRTILKAREMVRLGGGGALAGVVGRSWKPPRSDVLSATGGGTVRA